MSGPTNPEHELSSTLDRQADEFARLGGRDLDLAQVMSRAGEIRRGRRLRASLVMTAVVLAVAVPVGITAVVNQTDGTRPSHVATEPPTTSPTTTPTATPIDRSPLVLGDLPQGGAPGLPYALDGAVLGGPNGPIDTYKNQYVQGLVQLTGGFLVRHYDKQQNLVVTFLDDAGVVGQSWPILSGPIVSPDGNVGVFSQPDGTVIAVQDAGSRWFELSRIPGKDQAIDPISITGENCSDRSAEPGCSVIVTTMGNDPQVWQTWNGPAAIRLAAPFTALDRLSAVSRQGQSAGYTSIDDSKPGSCSATFDRSGISLFKTCDFSFDQFSPDGTHILATTPYRDGIYNPNVAVLDMNGDVLFNLRGNVMYSRWEDDEHVLVSIGDDTKKQSAVIRIGLDGHREYALAPRTSTLPDAGDGEYVLATNY